MIRQFSLGTLMVAVLAGCGGSAAHVTGTVKCSGKPVAGLILFSPVTIQSGNNAGEAISATLDAEGRYEATLPIAGKYRIVITPVDVVANPKPGAFDYPCDRTPIEKEFNVGHNDFPIEMSKRTK